MWYGKDTPELTKLKDEYEKITGYDADGEMSLEYGQDSYNDYVRDLQECIKRKITLGNLYPTEPDQL